MEKEHMLDEVRQILDTYVKLIEVEKNRSGVEGQAYGEGFRDGLIVAYNSIVDDLELLYNHLK